jgi:hypothetical protein
MKPSAGHRETPRNSIRAGLTCLLELFIVLGLLSRGTSVPARRDDMATILGDGVTVAQQFLVLLVQVRILIPQLILD